MLGAINNTNAFKGLITILKEKNNEVVFRKEYPTNQQQDDILKPFLMKCLSSEKDPYCCYKKDPWDLCPTTSIQLDNKIYDATKCLVSMNKYGQVYLQSKMRKDSNIKDDRVYIYSDQWQGDKDGTTVVFEYL